MQDLIPPSAELIKKGKSSEPEVRSGVYEIRGFAMRNDRINSVTGNKVPRRQRLRKWLSGFLAVSTALTMLGGNATALMADEAATEYALAGAGSGEDIEIPFGDGDDQTIRIHVNPATGTEETAAPAGLDSETEDEVETESGQEKVEAGDLVTISSVDGSLLPDEAEASAEIVTGKAENKAIEKVEEAEEADAPMGTADFGKADEPAGDQADSGKETAPVEKTEGRSNPEVTPAADTVPVGKAEYQVFEISLDNVDEEQYQDGFKVL